VWQLKEGRRLAFYKRLLGLNFVEEMPNLVQDLGEQQNYTCAVPLMNSDSHSYSLKKLSRSLNSDRGFAYDPFLSY
jgi:hypothetical protein